MFPYTLRRDVLVLLGLKAAALALIYVALVAPVGSPEPSSASMRAHLFSGQR